MTTIRDIAQLAGVSTATVSRILNGHPGQATPETAKRVMDAVRATHYVPNSVARSLRRQDSQTWALVLPNIENPFLTQVARGVEDVAHTKGFAVLLCNSDDDAAKERSYLKVAEAGRFSGVVLVPTTNSVDVRSLTQLGIPVVCALRPLRTELAADSVLMDTFSGSVEATSCLIRAGHRTIACLPGTRDNYSDRERLTGFRFAHESAGKAVDEDLIVFSNATVDGGHEAAEALHARGLPDAMLIANSMMAMGVIGSMVQRGMDPARGPRMIAFDDAPWIRELAPYLGVVQQPAYEFGRATASMLLDRLTEPGLTPRQLTLRTSLTVPDSWRSPVDRQGKLRARDEIVYAPR